ncbi:bacterial regulatory protein, LuxR family protein 6 [Achromobacter xylosoxidans A8]|uniref:Bacterial regulatory protein, LuxR family protein 6 n=1 Tax=Achromobacter xylosoxidans (strain A8) TaxID=762376 RepID=E3HIY1_ACHXA|nr:response regulator transcription factor [Achromobacter xylosoxidans]ADP15552.1 bacterial regulatory protein, LuxR family protein 6 [Achromobacter xylosoxidans A8]
MKPVPVLLITHDDLLWQHWRGLNPARWLTARGRGLADLQRWREQGRTLAVLDADLPRLPSWQDPVWATTLADMHVVVASPSPNDEQGTRVLGAGAHGYCHGYASAASLSQALEVVASGGIWMGRSLVSRLLKLVAERAQDAHSWDGGVLTEREITVARYASSGQANAQIAEALGITERTVKAHLSAVFEKLGVTDRLQLALLVHGISAPADVKIKITS